jgi:hypothetical protein
MKLNRIFFCLSFLLASCSLQLPDSSSLALFVTAPVEVTSPSEVVSGDFDKVKAYSFACLYSEMEGGGEAWGSELQPMTSSPTEISVQFKIPSLWVGRTYKIVLYAFKDTFDSNFRCPRVPSPETAWARLGYTKYVVPNKPEPIQVPFVDFFESIPETVITAPTISQVYPSSGAVGVPLFITGTGFASGATVLLGTTPCGSIQVQSDTQINCTVPSLADGVYDLSVINQNGSNVTQSRAFTYVTPPVGVSPVVNSVSPTKGKAETLITLQGTGFQSGVSVEINNIPCLNTALSVGTLVCQVPDLGNISQGVPITVTNPDNSQATFSGFYYDAAPPVVTLSGPLTLIGSDQLEVTFQLNESAHVSLHANDPTCESDPIAQQDFSDGAVQSLTTDSLLPGSYTIHLKAVDQVSNSICIPAGVAEILSPACPYEPCGSLGDSCYDDTVAMSSGFACLGDGTQIEYVDAASDFKVWKEKDGNRILKATGLWSSSSDWQKKLTRDGKSTADIDFDAISEIAGRACPTNVYRGPSEMTAIGECLYYDLGNSAQSLDKDSGTFGQDYLTVPFPVAENASWYQGNIKTCAEKGMRLPTLYETLEQSISGNFPTDATPAFGGTRVPAAGSATWTATAYLDPSQGVTGFWRWLGPNYYAPPTSVLSWPVRCVLHQPNLS